MTLPNGNSSRAPDLLEHLKIDNTSPDLRMLGEQNQLLLGVIQELQKSHASQRCVLDLQWNTQTPGVLALADDSVTIRFLAQGKPILADHVIVASNSDAIIHVGVNESLRHNAANTFFNGITVTTATRLNLPVQVEFLEIRISPGAGGLNIPVNNSTQLIPVAGQIQVYAWTIPAMSDF